jgi:hypothetical protein
VIRLPPLPHSHHEQPPDAAKFSPVMPIPMATTSPPLRIPSTPPQPPPKSPSSASPKQQQQYYRNHRSPLSHSASHVPGPVLVDPLHAAPPIKSTPVRSASVPIIAPPSRELPPLPLDTQTQSKYVQPYIRHQIHRLDDHGPYGEPPEEIHPVFPRRNHHPPSPSSRSSVVGPQEGYIPTATADGFIPLPPPHELQPESFYWEIGPSQFSRSASL